LGGRHGKKVIALCSFWLVVLIVPASAQSFDKGIAAYSRGDYDAAQHEFRILAEHGHVVAQANLSIMYFHGIGLPKNEAEAANWAFRAAEQGYAVAQAQLGYIYLNSTGATKDIEKAALWYRRAAELGHDVAQTTLGTLYFQGIGVQQDHSEAVKWFHLAAAQGNADAHAKLGVAFYRGDGAVQDNAQAYLWFSLATKQGVEGMDVILSFLATKLTSDEIADARRSVAECTEQNFGPGLMNNQAGIEQGRIISRDLYPDRYR
jgi:TPR repeat protein